MNKLAVKEKNTGVELESTEGLERRYAVLQRKLAVKNKLPLKDSAQVSTLRLFELHKQKALPLRRLVEQALPPATEKGDAVEFVELRFADRFKQGRKSTQDSMNRILEKMEEYPDDPSGRKLH